jgi:ubiquinone/menaquinone biosynthesis C-methylase UbiE
VSVTALSVADASVDTAVITYTLCLVKDPVKVLRVLRPGGRVLFLEHGLSSEAGVATWQQHLNRSGAGWLCDAV